MSNIDIRELLKEYFGKCEIQEKEDEIFINLNEIIEHKEIFKRIDHINNKLKTTNTTLKFNGFKEKQLTIKKTKINTSCLDHKAIGQKLQIFDTNPELGSGMPMGMENGLILKQIITSYINYIQRKNQITMVSTPELGKKTLYETSGHGDHYQENMFPPIKIENEEYILRPMTCPHHVLLYQRNKGHEKQLPIAYGENSRLYRYEYSGGLFGLERTRCMELIDTHMFCTKNQITKALEKAGNIIMEVKEAFEIEYDSIVLSLRSQDKKKFFDDDDLGNNAESSLKNFLETKQINIVEGLGDAAFYGPKIDFQIKTASNKIITISTIQLDFLLPQKFNLSYIDSNEQKQIPIMIHLGIIGTLERFVAYLLEKDNGGLPFGLSPIQISIIPINKSHEEYAEKLFRIYKNINLRVHIEKGDESLGKKIAKVVDKKSFGYLVIGDKEIEEIKNLNETEIFNKSRFNLEKELQKIKRSRKINESKKEKYPNNHLDFLNGAAFNLHE